jgi:hypothetical protein
LFSIDKRAYFRSCLGQAFELAEDIATELLSAVEEPRPARMTEEQHNMSRLIWSRNEIGRQAAAKRLTYRQIVASSPVPARWGGFFQCCWWTVSNASKISRPETVGLAQ